MRSGPTARDRLRGLFCKDGPGGPRYSAGDNPEGLSSSAGGASFCSLPHFVFGVSPISRTSEPPFAMAEWGNHGLSRGLPFNCAD